MRFDIKSQYLPTFSPIIPYQKEEIDQDHWKVSFLVPGISENNLEVTTIKNKIIIQILDNEEDERYFDFSPNSSYLLDEYMKVKEVRLKDGILQVDIEKCLPKELKPQKVYIQTNNKKK